MSCSCGPNCACDSLGAVAYSADVRDLQAALNRFAKFMKLSPITVDGKLGSQTATRLRQVTAALLKLPETLVVAITLHAHVFSVPSDEVYQLTYYQFVVADAAWLTAQLNTCAQLLGLDGTPGATATPAQTTIMDQAMRDAGVPRRSWGKIVVASALVVGLAGMVVLSKHRSDDA